MKERPVAIRYDKKGNPYWDSTLSKPDNSVAVAMMVPDRIIPVIFVPGVMGSNLRGNKPETKGVTWRLDSSTSMKPWLVRGAKRRKETLQPQLMEVDNEGRIPSSTEQDNEELKRRGWGEVGKYSYGDFLVWLENTLNDYDHPHGGVRDSLIGGVLQAEKGEVALTKDEVGLSYRYRFPVYACGYNWLDSNTNSSKRLQQRIEEIIKRYQKARKKCEKVILVTHSMGGLVARHCSQVLGMESKIFGIVHGVMPALGAAATYRRMKAGTENPGGSLSGWFGGYMASKALGEDAAEMTAVLSTAPGPLQLLPTPEYGNGWLQIKNGAQEDFLPKHNDPYTEIYTVRGEWWSLCEDHLVNPLNTAKDIKKKQTQMDANWEKFVASIDDDVEVFHKQITRKYHPNTHAFYSNDANKRAYGNVIWRGGNKAGENLLSGSRPSYPMAGRALNPNEAGSSRTIAAPLGGTGWKTGVQQRYTLSDPEEPGDGTVPLRSGVAPRQHVISMLSVNVGHEPAYKESERARLFTVRAIVKIMQNVNQTSLSYE